MIYCVEDERNIRELIVYTLESSGYQAKGFKDAKEFYPALEKEIPELILLDIMLPGEDGLSVLGKLRQNKTTKDIPVMMVTARGSEYDKILGLDGGADDYITKPFGMMEFLARVRAILRRSQKKENDQAMYEAGDLKLYVDKHQVFAGNRQVELTLKEFELLKFLLENKGIVMTRDKLLIGVWGYDFDGETRTVLCSYPYTASKAR